MKLTFSFLFFIAFCFLQLAFSQNNIEFKQLKGDNVPTQSITYALANDSIGNVWIASEEGLLKHNSKNYKIYNSYNGLPEILGNRIKEVYVDSKQRVWIGSEKGVSLYDENFDIFKYVGTNLEINPSLVEVITQDNDGNIWAGGYNGLWKYNESTKKFERKVANHNIQALTAFDNVLVFGTQNGVYYCNIGDDTLLEIEINNRSKNIRNITTFDDTILIGTKQGELYRIKNGEKSASKIDFDFNLSEAITDIIKDTDSSYLMATDGDGIYKLDADFKKIQQYTEDPNNLFSISSKGVYDIELNREGILWVATY